MIEEGDFVDLTQKIIEKLKEEYDFIEERPWARYPNYITLKEVESKKWFAAFLSAAGDKLGLSTDEQIPIVNVKADPDFVSMITVGNPGIFPGYHMNKQHWISIALDGTVTEDRILSLIDESYQILTDTPTRRIYEAVRRIPRGQVATYGQVAALAGNPKMSRAVGNALHKNPDGDKTPCYRVLNAKGELAEAFVFGGVNVQKERLMADGIEVVDGKVDLKKYAIDVDEMLREG